MSNKWLTQIVKALPVRSFTKSAVVSCSFSLSLLLGLKFRKEGAGVL